MEAILNKIYAVVCAGLLFCSSAYAQGIDFVDADFSVTINNKQTEAANHLTIARDGTHYRVDFALEHWMVTSIQKATFDMNDCTVHPVSYSDTSKRPFKDEKVQTLAFDAEHNKVTYHSGDEEKTFSWDQALYDPISLFFEARCDLIAGKTDFTYPVIRKGSRKNQRYRVVDTQTVNTGQGDVQALVIERERKNKKRQTRLYVAPELGYLLVKIEHQESSLLKVVATLKRMDYGLVSDD